MFFQLGKHNATYSAKSIAHIPNMKVIMCVCPILSRWIMQITTCSSAEIQNSLGILDGGKKQPAAGDHQVDMMGEIHASLFVLIIWLFFGQYAG